jgi:MFS family permease
LGYTDVEVLAALLAGVLAAVGFVRRERRASTPLIDLSLLRSSAISRGLTSGLIAYLVLFGTLFVVPYYLSAKEVPAALIGLQLAILPVALGIAAPIAGRLLNRVGDVPLTVGGLAIAAAGSLEIAFVHGTAGLLTGLALAGLGLGAFTPPNNATIMSAAPKGHAGVVSGMLNMTRGIGTALGVAVAGALYTAAAGTGSGNAAHASLTGAAHGLTIAFVVLGSLALATALWGWAWSTGRLTRTPGPARGAESPRTSSAARGAEAPRTPSPAPGAEAPAYQS